MDRRAGSPSGGDRTGRDDDERGAARRALHAGVGSGEALNEHVLGDRWPSADERLETLGEAIEVMRALWAGGVVHPRGRHYTVEHARVYDLPDSPPPVIVSGFGPKATSLAARVGDGYATTTPDDELISRYRAEGGSGPVQAGAKVCFGPDEQEFLLMVYLRRPRRAARP